LTQLYYLNLGNNLFNCIETSFTAMVNTTTGAGLDCELTPNSFSYIEDGICDWLTIQSTWQSTCTFPCSSIGTLSPTIGPTMAPTVAPTMSPTIGITLPLTIAEGTCNLQT